MSHERYPHMVYKDGVAHLDDGHNEDFRIVNDEAEELEAAKDGYVSAVDPITVETEQAPRRRGRPPGSKASDNDSAGE